MSLKEVYERNFGEHFYLREELHFVVSKVDVKDGDIGTNMKPVKRKKYWDKYEEILGQIWNLCKEKILRQIWKDIGTNMKPV